MLSGVSLVYVSHTQNLYFVHRVLHSYLVILCANLEFSFSAFLCRNLHSLYLYLGSLLGFAVLHFPVSQKSSLCKSLSHCWYKIPDWSFICSHFEPQSSGPMQHSLAEESGKGGAQGMGNRKQRVQKGTREPSPSWVTLIVTVSQTTSASSQWVSCNGPVIPAPSIRPCLWWREALWGHLDINCHITTKVIQCEAFPAAVCEALCLKFQMTVHKAEYLFWIMNTIAFSFHNVKCAQEDLNCLTAHREGPSHC